MKVQISKAAHEGLVAGTTLLGNVKEFKGKVKNVSHAKNYESNFFVLVECEGATLAMHEADFSNFFKSKYPAKVAPIKKGKTITGYEYDLAGVEIVVKDGAMS